MKRTSSGKIYHNNRIIDFVSDVRQMLECKMTSGEDKKSFSSEALALPGGRRRDREGEGSP